MTLQKLFKSYKILLIAAISCIKGEINRVKIKKNTKVLKL